MIRADLEAKGMKNLPGRAIWISIELEGRQPEEGMDLGKETMAQVNQSRLTFRLVSGGLAILVSENPHSVKSLPEFDAWLTAKNIRHGFLERD